MTNPQAPPIPAGWFRDPGGTEQLRWWDGTAWTAHLAPAPTPQPAPQAIPIPTPTVAQAPSPVPVDPDERPYVPFQNAWSTAGGGSVMGPGEFARPAQWNTGGIWFIATSVFWSGLLGGVVGFAGALVPSLRPYVLTAGTPGYSAVDLGLVTLVLVLLLIAAGRDRSRLLRMGYQQPPAIWWILLLPFTPLAYMIVRTSRVRRESGHGSAPLVFFLATYGVVVVLGIAAAIAIPAFLASRGALGDTVTQTANATSLATGITTGMDKNGGSYSVTCTPFAKPTTSPVEVTCIAVDLASQKSHTLQIEVDPSIDGGQPTVKLLSVNPPINQ